jgi:DNA-binding PadR family transcriptional regulator
MRLTAPQHAALSRIALEPNGYMPLRWINCRMVNCYRVARSLEEKGLVTRTCAGRDSPDYLHITPKGREALAEVMP